MRPLAHIGRAWLLALVLPLPCSAIPAEGEPPPDPHLNDPQPTSVLVRVVAHGALVLGRDVGGAKVTITDLATGQILAAGVQEGGSGDQNHIMRTPHLMSEPIYSGRPAAAFKATLELRRPTLVEIKAEGPLAHPDSMRQASQTVLLLPGQDLTSDGIVLPLYGYIVHIEHPTAGQALIAKDDVKLQASVRTLSGTLVRPHGDWDSRKIHIYGELLIGDRIIERLQMFFSNETNTFEAPFFVPSDTGAPDGITLRVVAADPAAGNFSVGEGHFPVLSERLPAARR